MPNIAKVLREEILRLARKEAKSATSKLRADCVTLKRRAADQKRRVTALERDVKKFRSVAKEGLAQGAAPSEQELRGARISSEMVKRLRAKLGLSQADFARLVNVSAISVYMWERKGGRLQLRNATRTAFLAVRKMGKREAQAKLAELQGGEPPRQKRKPGRPATSKRQTRKK
ncbi:MAG: helix-turn-helix domain-containing protein [Verrucomicrobia bacterium]|nr:helix-turn-helix domain-containing protein [Verrucomicrobiota bacterium]